MDWAFSRLSSRGQSLLRAVTDTIPHVSQGRLPVRRVLTAGRFLQKHLGKHLWGFFCGPCADLGKQEEIQNCLKAQSQNSLKSQTNHDERLGWGQPASLPPLLLLICIQEAASSLCDCTLVNNFSCRYGQQMLLMPVWTLQCVYNRGRSSDLVLLNNGCSHQKEVPLVTAILLQLAQNTLKGGHAIALRALKGTDSQIWAK